MTNVRRYPEIRIRVHMIVCIKLTPRLKKVHLINQLNRYYDWNVHKWLHIHPTEYVLESFYGQKCFERSVFISSFRKFILGRCIYRGIIFHAWLVESHQTMWQTGNFIMGHTRGLWLTWWVHNLELPLNISSI